jgi:hypothetical protein
MFTLLDTISVYDNVCGILGVAEHVTRASSYVERYLGTPTFNRVCGITRVLYACGSINFV